MRGNRYLLDSNFLIDFMNGVDFATRYFKTIVGEKRYISVVTKIELLSFTEHSSEKERDVRQFLERFHIVPLREPVEELTVALRRATRRKLPDAIIAASAVHIDATLVTSDKQLAKPSFPGLRVVNPMIC